MVRRLGSVPWAGLAAGGLLFAASLALKWPLQAAPPFGDEGVHYWTARYLGQRTDALVNLWGYPMAAPATLLWQRPLFYLVSWLPAQAGFMAFRAAQAVLASLLAPAAYALLRRRGHATVTALLAGLAVAATPRLVLWGAYGLTDSAMTLALAGLVWAHGEGRPRAALIAALAATWFKETAYLAVLALLGLELWRARRELSFWPRLALPPMATALAWAAAIAPLPLVWALAHDLPQPGGASSAGTVAVLQGLFVSAWTVPVLVAGLAWARSRAMCAWALAAAAAIVAVHLAGRATEPWYMVPATFLGLLAVAVTCEEVARQLWAVPARRWLGFLPSAFAVLVVLLAVTAPAAGRVVRSPWVGDDPNDLATTWHWQVHGRDAAMQAAIAALPLDGRHDILVLDLPPTVILVPVVEDASQAWWDSTVVRSVFPLDVQPLAHRIEANATWTLLDRTGLATAVAIEDTYADCVRFRNEAYLVIEGSPCAGRAEALEQAWRDASGPTP
ncbi:MAG: hypothetical protein AABY18_06010 [Candidatus Thermoplasmatota archaeon]